MLARLASVIWTSACCVALYCTGLSETSAQAQALSSNTKPANDLLDTYLLYADELSGRFCARFEGSLTTVDRQSQSEANTYIITAASVDAGARYVAFGLEELDSGRNVMWEEHLSVPKKRLYKTTVGFGSLTKAHNRMTRDEFGNEVPRKTVFSDVFNPFSLSIFAEVGIITNDIDLELMKRVYLGSEMLSTVVDSNSGNVAGEWLLIPSKTSVAQITFGAKSNYNPICTKMFRYDGVTKTKAKEPYSVVNTAWEKNTRGLWLPARVEMKTVEPATGQRRERSFKIAWANPDLLKRDKFDFERLAVEGLPIDWQNAFLTLFNK